MDNKMEIDTMVQEHEELMNSIEIIAETSETIEEFLEKFRRLRKKKKDPDQPSE